MKIIFFGSDDFATVNLDQLKKAGHEICACVTPPDKAKGRGLKVVPLPVKEWAQKHKIPIFQPLTLKDKDFIAQLKNYQSDVFIVIAYGKVLPVEVLKVPKLCPINVHASLLPRYRGAAPINWAIMNGDKETGVSIIRMNELMDAGDILLQKKVKITERDNAVTLRVQLAHVGAEGLCETLQLLSQGNVKPVKQDLSQVTLAPKLTKELGVIDWKKSAGKIHNSVRALVPWPTAHTFYKNKILKVLESDIVSGHPAGSPGAVVDVSATGLLIATGQGSLLIKKVHPESGKAMEAYRFAIGHGLVQGVCLG